jgi:hypothetical protein
LTYAPLAYAAVKDAWQRRLMDVVSDELVHIESQVEVPPYVVTTAVPLDKDAQTVIAAVPVKYTIIVTEWRFLREVPTRRVVAHEAGHIMLDHYGLPQSEHMADVFADCYSSVGKGGDSCREWEEYLLTGKRK